MVVRGGAGLWVGLSLYLGGLYVGVIEKGRLRRERDRP
jgi:hypothetical protein